jgi:hypothetical protein
MKNLTLLLALLLSTCAFSQTISHNVLLEKVKCKTNNCLAPFAKDAGFVLDKTDTTTNPHRFAYLATSPSVSPKTPGVIVKSTLDYSISREGFSSIKIESVADTYYNTVMDEAEKDGFAYFKTEFDKNQSLLVYYKSPKQPNYLYIFKLSNGVDADGKKYVIYTVAISAN